MTDAQIIRALAEKVMGYDLSWVREHDNGTIIQIAHRKSNPGWRAWSPLRSDADSCAVLDKMVKDGAYVAIEGVYAAWMVRVDRSDEAKGSGQFYVHEDRRRAICIAALKAVGAWEE